MPEFTKQDTFDKVAVIIAEKLSIDPSSIKDESTLQDLGADSLDIVEIIMRLEEQFGIQIKDEQAEGLETVGDVVTYVNELRSK